MEYIVFIYKENNDYVAVVPDLNFVSSYGSSFMEVVHNIKEASELFCQELETLPKPSNLEKLLKLKDIQKVVNPTSHKYILTLRAASTEEIEVVHKSIGKHLKDLPFNQKFCILDTNEGLDYPHE